MRLCSVHGARPREQVLLDERERAAEHRAELRDAGAEVAAAMQLVPYPRRADALVVTRELRVGRRAFERERREDRFRREHPASSSPCANP